MSLGDLEGIVERMGNVDRDIEKDLIEIECAIKSQKEKDNIFTMSVLQRCYKLVSQLKEYKDLEEQGKLLKLPCAVGDTVYVILSKTNYKLNIINGLGENNRVYEQVVNRIEISKTGYLLATCDGMASVVDAFYKKNWFLTREEAEAALKELERGYSE